MLRNTFIHIPGIGRTTERSLWSAGVRSWEDVDVMRPSTLKRALKSRLSESVAQSEAALRSKDMPYFSRLCTMGESWRLYNAFAEDCVFLDIETTGLSPVFNTITMVGLFDGREYRLFVEGRNLDELPEALRGYRIAVTFNGAQFDLRFLQAAFPGIQLPAIHIDLRWLTARLGYRGGLKSIEAEFGIERPQRIATVNGFDATVLWAKFQRGDDAALRLLTDYNTQDVVNLKTIMETCYGRLATATTEFIAAKPFVRKRRAALPRPSNISEPFTSPRASQSQLVRQLVAQAKAAKNGTRVVGIDLTGSERRASGWALLNGNAITSTSLIRSDDELIRRTIDAAPDLVSIDSPLSLPGGLDTVEECRRAGLPIYRACELALKRMGISVFWCLLPSMQSLTLRGIALTRAFRAAGIPVIESYPGAAQDLLRIPRKGASLEELRLGLHRAGVDGSFSSQKTSHDEVDAITSALVGLFYLAGEHIPLGNATEDYLIVPRSPQIDYLKLAAILKQSGLDGLKPYSADVPSMCA